ncbi:unnamed protein product [Ambrosiozyma monospora]|uniref:Unnamed protein product n=1 Tax=Ambrosiozyma monospora TaxID=43982 RepID=A0ACB5T835_AMBMO|nr:unnamed protein product [Ambrosiozyma monospora]
MISMRRNRTKSDATTNSVSSSTSAASQSQSQTQPQIQAQTQSQSHLSHQYQFKGSPEMFTKQPESPGLFSKNVGAGGGLRRATSNSSFSINNPSANELTSRRKYSSGNSISGGASPSVVFGATYPPPFDPSVLSSGRELQLKVNENNGGGAGSTEARRGSSEQFKGWEAPVMNTLQPSSPNASSPRIVFSSADDDDTVEDLEHVIVSSPESQRNSSVSSSPYSQFFAQHAQQSQQQQQQQGMSAYGRPTMPTIRSSDELSNGATSGAGVFERHDTATSEATIVDEKQKQSEETQQQHEQQRELPQQPIIIQYRKGQNDNPALAAATAATVSHIDTESGVAAGGAKRVVSRSSTVESQSSGAGARRGVSHSSTVDGQSSAVSGGSGTQHHLSRRAPPPLPPR